MCGFGGHTESSRLTFEKMCPGFEPMLPDLILGYMKKLDRLSHVYIRPTRNIGWIKSLYAKVVYILLENLAIMIVGGATFTSDTSIHSWVQTMNTSSTYLTRGTNATWQHEKWNISQYEVLRLAALAWVPPSFNSSINNLLLLSVMSEVIFYVLLPCIFYWYNLNLVTSI